MITCLQILFGLVIGCVGFCQIADNPSPGCSALLVGGLLVLAGIDRLCRVSR